MKFFTIILFSLFSFISVAKSQNNVEPQVGKASYYAKKFNNRKTASGVLYKSEDMVCAHPTLPFGTMLLVRNMKNNKTVVVEVVDRGPFVKGRIIDVSYAAAKELSIVHHGVAKVEIREYNMLYDFDENKIEMQDPYLLSLADTDIHDKFKDVVALPLL